MGEVEFRCRDYAGDNPAAASIVAGFGGNRVEFEPAALALLERGYDVYAYDYDPSVLLEGDPALLPGLITDIKHDFESRATATVTNRHVGVSLGCGIAWNLQKDGGAKIEPGLYSAGGTDVAKLIMRNYVFQAAIAGCFKQNIKKTYENNGFSEVDLRDYWAEIHTPPDNGFVLALSDADLIIPTWQVRPRVRQWERAGIPFRTKTLRHLGHTGMKKWLINNIPEMLQLSDGMIESKHGGC